MDSKVASARVTTWFVLCSVVAVLALARTFLVPVALAAFVAFVLAPLVRRMTRAGMPRLMATILTMSGVAVLALGVGWVVVAQLRSFAERLPEYRWNLRDKVGDFRSVVMTRVEQATATFRELGNDLTAGQPGAATAVETQAAAAPAAGQELTDWGLQDALSSVFEVSVTAGLVLVFACAMLLRWEDLRDRLLALAGEADLQVTLHAVEDASRKVSIYLREQLLVNTIHGVAVGLILTWIGVPTPLIWGFLAGILRFVPYLGPLVGTAVPILVSFASSEGWTQTWTTAGALLALEIVSNNVLEPWIYGTGTGVSPLALLVSAAFWTWIWGPVGLILSTPLSVCLLVIGRHFPMLRFLNVLVGDEPVASLPARLFQRMLAGDSDAAWEILRAQSTQQSVLAAADEALLPALGLAGTARAEGRVDADSHVRIGAIAHQLVDEVEDLGRTPAAPLRPRALRLACFPARDASDAVAARVLASELARRGMVARAEPPERLLSEIVESVVRGDVDCVAVSSVVPTHFLHVRSICKRLLAANPGLDVLVGLWGEELPRDELALRLPASPRVHVATSLAEAIAWSEARAVGVEGREDPRAAAG